MANMYSEFVTLDQIQDEVSDEDYVCFSNEHKRNAYSNHAIKSASGETVDVYDCINIGADILLKSKEEITL